MAHEHAPKHEHKSHEHESRPHALDKHHERLRKLHEKAAEAATKSIEREITEARQAVRSETAHVEATLSPQEKAMFVPRHTKVDKLHSFNTTMHHVRQSLKAPERTFSKLIHQPMVEKVSEVAGKTVARPSGVIGATFAAALGLLLIYGIARFAGFSLSGSEMPLLLAIGFGIGLFVEWVFKSIRSLFGQSTV